MTAVITK